jgi:surface polysaccharide O-acyltransferase-like enzyme
MHTSAPTSTSSPAVAVPSDTDAAAREFYIDALRVLALGLLILYHVGMAYTSWHWHVKSAWSASVAAGVENAMRLTGPWRMTLLFVISGLALSLMLRRRGGGHGSGVGNGVGSPGGSGGGWLRERARRLLLPLVTAVVLVVPVQSYFEVRQFHGFDGSYVGFLKLYFTAYGGFCTAARGCLVLPTWNHLWFVPYLFVYSAVLALVLRRGPQGLDRAAAALPRVLAGWRLLLLPIAWFLLTRLALAPVFGQTHALVDDGFLHAQYAPAFALGVLLARPAAAATVLPRVEQQRHTALAGALLCWGLLVATAPGPAWRWLPWSVMQWCGVVAAIGYARVHLTRGGAAWRYLSGAVFPVYLFHQSVTVAAVAMLAPWRLPFAAEAALLIVLTLAASVAAYEAVRRVPVLRPWCGVTSPPAGRRPRHLT